MTDALDLDRIAPTRRPDGPNAGTQRWRELLFVHWAFAPELVRPLVPPTFELDLWQGRAWVGLVPFRMEATRAAWMPRRAGLDFLETNVRTYIHRNGAPGVYFFSLEAASWLAVRAARLMWGLPYRHAEMTTEREGDRIRYRSRRLDDERSPKLELGYELGERLGPSAPGTLEHFLLERYLLFVEKRGVPLVGQVHHPPYPARRATLLSLRDDLLSAAGLSPGEPETVHACDGVDVEVFGPTPA